jgi:hypothetical protein
VIAAKLVTALLLMELQKEFAQNAQLDKLVNVTLTGPASPRLRVTIRAHLCARKINARLRTKKLIVKDSRITVTSICSVQRPLNVIKMRIVKRPTTVIPLTLFVLSALSVKVDNVLLTGLAKKVQMREFASRMNVQSKHKVKIAQDLQTTVTQLTSSAQRL